MNTYFDAGNTWHLRLSLRWAPTAGVEVQEEYWDDLISWCGQRGAYLGGTPSRAFVLIRSAGAPLQRKLTKWLTSGASLADFELETVLIGEPHTSPENGANYDGQSAIRPSDGPALLEALAHYQQCLQAQMQWTIALMPCIGRCIIPLGPHGVLPSTVR